MLVTKLLGAGGAAEDRDEGPAEVAPDKHTRTLPRDSNGATHVSDI
jgi:hypothetical protein